jgi:hypothetical protein
MARKNGNSQHEGWGLMVEAMCRLQVGELEAAANLAESAAKVLGQNITATDILCIKGVLALTHLHQGNEQTGLFMADEVRDTLLASPPILAGIGPGFGLALAAYTLAWENNLGNEPTGETIAYFDLSVSKLLKAFRRFMRFFDSTNPDFWQWQGCYHWLKGEQKKAFKLWRQGAAIGQQQGWPYHEGRIRFQLGLRLPEVEAERREQLQRAYVCFESVGATADLDKVRGLLDSE